MRYLSQWLICPTRISRASSSVCVMPHLMCVWPIMPKVRIQNNVSIYEGVELEDNVFCGPSCVFTNVSTPRAHFPVHGAYARTHVREGASLGANCTVVCGHTIGRSAMIAAGAVVTRDVKDYALMAGVPARQIGWVCECGRRLDGSYACACGRKYRLTGENLEKAE